ncbi:MAG TPA: SDR family NAD(P)-dependent oxidoreductase, partial [Ktedonobacterales bacterium]
MDGERARIFRARYGPWALVAGASAGLGAQYASQLAALGLHVILVARRAAELEALANRLRADHGVETRTLALDLARPDA